MGGMNAERTGPLRPVPSLVYLIELSLPGIASVTCAAVRQPKGGLHPEMQYRSGHKTTDEV
jgi:hypothetical protein